MIRDECLGPPIGQLSPLLLIFLLPTLASPLTAQACTAPGSHATIQAAVDDPTCATITLSAQTYTESVNISRSLSLAGLEGGGTIIQGRLRAEGAGTQVALQDLRVENGCARSAFEAVGGAEVSGSHLEVQRSTVLPCPPFFILFGDGFESGDSSAWSTTVP